MEEPSSFPGRLPGIYLERIPGSYVEPVAPPRRRWYTALASRLGSWLADAQPTTIVFAARPLIRNGMPLWIALASLTFAVHGVFDIGKSEPHDRSSLGAKSTAHDILPAFGGLIGIGTGARSEARAPPLCSVGSPLRSTGTIKYFCDCQAGAQAGCVAGSDANAGTSPASPKQSLSALVTAFNAMSGGDTIALCDGGAWTTSTAVAFSTTNASCSGTANNRDPSLTTTCDIRDYAPPWGGTTRPILTETGAVNLLEFWSSVTTGVRIMNLDLEGGGVGVRGIAIGNTGGGGNNDNYLICNNVINGWTLGIHINGSLGVGDDIWGNRITSCSQDGVLGGSSGGKIDSNVFQDAGALDASKHAIYLDATTTEVTNFSVINNSITYTRDCLGVMIVFHGIMDTVNVENNIVDAGAFATGSCWGIDFGDGGYPTACYFRHVTVRRNFVRAGFRNIDLSEAPNGIIENNVVVMNVTGSGIAAPEHLHRTTPVIDDTMTAGTVRNNTIYVSSSASNSTGILAVNEGTGYITANNAIVFNATGGSCLSALPPASYAYENRQLCNGYANWEATQGSLAAWQAFSGLDGASLNSAPQFVDVTSPPNGFKPANGSPLIGAGDGAQAPSFDFAQKSRPTPPSIGAYEQ